MAQQDPNHNTTEAAMSTALEPHNKSPITLPPNPTFTPEQLATISTFLHHLSPHLTPLPPSPLLPNLTLASALRLLTNLTTLYTTPPLDRLYILRAILAPGPTEPTLPDSKPACLSDTLWAQLTHAFLLAQLSHTVDGMIYGCVVDERAAGRFVMLMEGVLAGVVAEGGMLEAEVWGAGPGELELREMARSAREEIRVGGEWVEGVVQEGRGLEQRAAGLVGKVKDGRWEERVRENRERAGLWPGDWELLGIGSEEEDV